jgi:hypothetical protein
MMAAALADGFDDARHPVVPCGGGQNASTTPW